jgi:repressor LexA
MTVDNLQQQADYILQQLARKDPLMHRLLKLGCECAGNGEWGQAEESFKRCCELGQALDNPCTEAASLVAVAASCLQRGDLSLAAEHYRRAADLFEASSEKYGHATSLFGLALLWHGQRQWPEAFKYYEQSLVPATRPPVDDLLKHLGNEILTWRDVAYHQYHLERRGAAPGQPATEEERLEQRTPAEAPVTPMSEAPLATPEESLFFGELLFMPVVGKIAAGHPSPRQEDIEDYLRVSVVSIGDKQYRVEVLGWGHSRQLKMEMAYRYFVLKVVGHSMVDADIDDGDYVVVRQPRDVPPRPVDEDIVVATITDFESEATLKRFVRLGRNRIALRPESASHPEYETYEFSERDRTVEIAGVVVALLKEV